MRFAGRTCSGYKPRRQDVSGGRTDLGDEELSGGYADFIYPNLTPLPQPTMLMMVRADPLSPDRTRLFSRIYGLEESIEVQNAHLDSLHETNREDTDMVTVLMQNLRSPFYRVGPPSTWEGRAAHMIKQIRADAEVPLDDDEFSAPTLR